MGNEHNIYSDIDNVEQLFRKYYRALRAYAFRFVNDTHIAENIVQDVFFELWIKRENLQFTPGIKAYLFKAVYHRSLNHINNPSFLNQTQLEDYAEDSRFTEYFISHDKGAEYLLMMEDLTNEIEAIINKLPPQCKTVFLLSRKKELKNKEIAEQLGISVKAVEKQMTKAISIFRNELKEKGILLLLYLLV